jgi:hypothetical protein
MVTLDSFSEADSAIDHKNFIRWAALIELDKDYKEKTKRAEKD